MLDRKADVTTRYYNKLKSINLLVLKVSQTFVSQTTEHNIWTALRL